VARHARIVCNPIRPYDLLPHLDQRQVDAAGCPDMIAEQVNGISDGRRLANRRNEMGRHAIQQHERMVIHGTNRPQGRSRRTASVYSPVRSSRWQAASEETTRS